MLFNRDRARAYMRSHGLDALVATSPINVAYFSDYYCWLDPLVKEYFFAPGAPAHLRELYAVFPLEGEPAVVVDSAFAVNGADGWVRDVRINGDPGFDLALAPSSLSETARRFHEIVARPPRDLAPTPALVGVLRDRNLTRGRIGVELEGVPPERRAALERALPQATLLDCSNLIRLVRMVKSAEELVRIERAHEICERAAVESFALARPGLEVSVLQQHYRTRLAEQGADFDHFSFGYEGVGIGHEPTYRLRKDDVLYIDFAGVYRHYYGDSGATLALAEPSAPLRDRFTALYDAVQTGRDAIRPGVRASVVCGAMWTVLEARGVTRLFPHGHGIGLECRDYPIIVRDNGLRIRDDCVDVASDLPLEENMILELEAGMFLPGVGSLNTECAFLVTADGQRPLLRQARDRPFQPAGARP